MPAPDRDGFVWLTTPVPGKPGAALPKPAMKCAYVGPAKDLKFDQPVRIAGVRFHQTGPTAEEFRLRVEAVAPGGGITQLVPESQAKPAKARGVWLMLGPVQNAAPIEAAEVRVAKDKSLSTMEIWTVVN